MKDTFLRASRQLSVLFAPDYRAGNPYQTLLAEAMRSFDVDISFLSDYRRVLPLARGVRSRPSDILHLHWPEYYYDAGTGLPRTLRRLRYPFDLAWAVRDKCLAVTAHNLSPHSGTDRNALDTRIRHGLRKAGIVFAHSDRAKLEIAKLADIDHSKIQVIPHGDLSAALPMPPNRETALDRLALRSDRKYALVFGRLAPYKGIEEIIEFWIREKLNIVLILAGPPSDIGFEGTLKRIAGNSHNVVLHLRKVSDEDLVAFLAGSDCTIFNYQKLLTSGSAALARSVGIPLLFPERIQTVDLGEPSPRVFRFKKLDRDFIVQLQRAVQLSVDYESAADWRQNTSWQVVAAKTVAAYHRILGRDFPATKIANLIPCS
jgi:beta-1,4-mannosyltransferase